MKNILFNPVKRLTVKRFFLANLGTIIKTLKYILRLQSWKARLGKHGLNFFQNHVGESALAMQFSVSEGSHASQSRYTGIQN